MIVAHLWVLNALTTRVDWALYIVLGQKAGASYGADAVTPSTLIETLAIIPFGVAHAATDLFLPALLPMALGVAILSSALLYSLEMIALTGCRYC